MKTNSDFMVKLKYSSEGKDKDIDFCASGTNDDLDYFYDYNDNRLIVNIVPHNNNIAIKSAEIMYKYKFLDDSRIFVNGYQSWTDSREYSKLEKMHSINKIPKFIINKYSFDKYGDYTFKNYSDKAGVFHGYSYGYVRNEDNYELIGSLSENSGFTIINYDVNSSDIIIQKDCSGIIIDKPYNLFDICFLEGKENYVFDTYFKMMGVTLKTEKAMTGYTSWYNHYQNISEEIIKSNIESIFECESKLDIFQIDDGYQTAVGDWLSIDKNKFPNGMKSVCDIIKAKGLIPGIWLAPFVCEEKSDIFNNHKDWIIKDENGELLKAGSNWSGFYSLDFYNEEVRKYIRKCFDTIIKDWGFELVKLDFLYAVCLLPYNNKSRGQIMCEAMDFLRECVGDKMILGCGVPLAPAFGKVDFCRIGCDIGLDFDDNFIMRKMHRERISTKNAIYNTIYRRQLDKRAFLNDPDVFLLRDDNIKLKDYQKENLCLINSLFGSLLFTSDNIGSYSKDKKEKFLKALKNLDAVVDKVVEKKAGQFYVYYSIKNNKYKIKIDLFLAK